MKKLLILLAAVALTSSCRTLLYYWGPGTAGVSAYDNITYEYYKDQNPEALCKTISMYEDIIAHPGESRKMPPPGTCAEYGYLLLQPNTASIFAEEATEKQKALFPSSKYSEYFKIHGKEMLEKEIQYYPESKPYIEPLLEKLTK